VPSVGGHGNENSFSSSIDGAGRHVAYAADASNLVGGDTNGASDVFVRDLLGGSTKRISVTTAGAQADAGGSDPSISNDGQVVAFRSEASNLVAGDENGAEDVFLRSQSTNRTDVVAVDASGAPAAGSS
jgi:Tol biopolymer transport system component